MLSPGSYLIHIASIDIWKCQHCAILVQAKILICLLYPQKTVRSFWSMFVCIDSTAVAHIPLVPVKWSKKCVFSWRQSVPSGPWKVEKVGSNIVRDSEGHCYRQLMRWMWGFAFASQFSRMCTMSAFPPFHGFPALLNTTSFICIP